MTELEKCDESIKWLELFKVIIQQEFNHSINANDLFVNLNKSINSYIEICNNNKIKLANTEL